MSTNGPLEGIRVVELAQWVAGPAAAGIMADWGADVVKIESSSGDPQRALFGSIGGNDALPVAPFEVDNRGKRSVVLDLRSDSGLETCHALLQRADVLVTNMRPAALERLGLDHESLCARYPRLVYGSITGSGYGMPWSRNGSDTVADQRSRATRRATARASR